MMTTERSLEGTVALVTGAMGNIGQAICSALEAEGAAVVPTDVPGAALPGSGLALDVTDEAAWREVVDALRNRYGRLDILVLNAAIAPVAGISELSLADWRKVQAVNVDGVFLGLKATQDLMAQSGELRRGGASAIVISSAGGIVGAPFNSAYCTSKGAVRQLTKAAAVEFSALGQKIRVNSVHPGCVDTEMMTGIMEDMVQRGAFPSLDAARAGFAAAHPIGRMCKPAEVADGVVFLASPKASFIHASEFLIDGGFLAR